MISLDEREDELADWDFNGDVMHFEPMFYNEPILYLEKKWNRRLDHHEKHIVGEIYDWCRTRLEVEEIKLFEWMVKKNNER